MKRILLFCFTLSYIISYAQVPEDAIRYSWYVPNGSARNMATGGVMGSLGGELTATFVNPAGLGLFKTNEFVFTPGLISNQNKINYRDSLNINKKNAFNFGPIGWIFGLPDFFHKNKSAAISIAFNKTTSFNNNISYTALNNYSSFSEQFAEEFAKSNKSIDEVLSSNSSMPYTAAPALYTYLIDTVRTANGALQVKAAPEYLLDAGNALRQEMNRTTRGGMYELALAFATNVKEKWLYGATLGIPFIHYKSTTTFRESDITGDTANHFNSFTYMDDFKTVGTGLNLKMGVIYRPKEYIRLGFALHTPSLMVMTDTRTTTLSTDLENPKGNYSVSSTVFTNNQAGKSQYGLNTPWKAMISASYVFRELEDVKRQRAFISADLEYVRHRASRFTSQNEEPTTAEQAYFKSLNNVIKNEYKGTLNARIGGEIKFNVVMARLGFAYYSNPYKDPEFKGSKMLVSGGLGYRNHGFFADLTYVYNMMKQVDLPYRLSDRANTFANIRQNQGNIIGTIGIKF